MGGAAKTETTGTDTKPAEADAEHLLRQFQFERILNQGNLLGSLQAQPAILNIERTALPARAGYYTTLPAQVTQVQTLGHNDIYAWLLASSSSSSSSPASGSASASAWADASIDRDLKLNLIYPCTESHIKKYSPQGARMVTETPRIYRELVRPYMARKRDRLNWVWNVIEGRAEQDDVVARVKDPIKGFVLAPDLNWDRRTLSSLHLLALVERRDLWSLRDLTTTDVPWLKQMRRRLLKAITSVYPAIERDQLKLYLHYQPTYYHFHIHIVHVQLESGFTQATGKAWGFESVIAQLQGMASAVHPAAAAAGAGSTEVGMADVDITYGLGEASELWTEVFAPLKAKGLAETEEEEEEDEDEDDEQEQKPKLKESTFELA
ncbi:MAG: hypothetical protein M1826_002261 [Phylliscum demangeonii]|nr:MAG: hypothetical protein M1826_002261 [Phylliscum demangeonii]